MSFTGDSKQQIALKKLVGKAHTKNEFEFFNESKSSGLTVSFDKIIGEIIPATPSKGTTYAITDGVVEFVRLPLIILDESEQSGNIHAFAAKLPPNTTSSSNDGYEASSSNPLKGSGEFVDDKQIYSTNGKIQFIPDSYGNLYGVKVFKNGNYGKGSGTEIPKLDDRNWYFDYFNGILFQQTGFPRTGSGSAENPDFIEAFIYIGKMADKKAGSLSSMWEEVSGELVPTGIIDGNTGVFAADFNIDLLDDGEVELFKITTTEREDAQDLYFELDSNGDIMPKE